VPTVRKLGRLRRLVLGFGLALIIALAGCQAGPASARAAAPYGRHAATPSVHSPVATSVLPTVLSDDCAPLASSGAQARGIPLPVGLYVQGDPNGSAIHFASPDCGAALFTFFTTTLGPAGWTILAADRQTPQQFAIRCRHDAARQDITIIGYAAGDGAYVVIASDG